MVDQVKGFMPMVQLILVCLSKCIMSQETTQIMLRYDHKITLFIRITYNLYAKIYISLIQLVSYIFVFILIFFLRYCIMCLYDHCPTIVILLTGDKI